MPEYSLFQIIAMFFIYAFLGWCAEVAFAAVGTGKFVNRGFLNGPICPIYGFGVVALVLLLFPLRDDIFLLFLASVAVTTLLELFTGWILEKVFHMKWWDYSNERFNIGGYICLEFSVLWGFGALLILKVVHPVIYGFISLIPHTLGLVLLVIFMIATVVDLICTVSAIMKLQKRLALITSLGSEMREFSDKLGDAISGRVIRTFDAAFETKEMYAELREMMDQHRKEEKALAEKNKAEEQELWETIRGVGRQRKERYEEAEKKHNEIVEKKSASQTRIVKAFPNLKVYGYENALKELREAIENLKDYMK